MIPVMKPKQIFLFGLNCEEFINQNGVWMTESHYLSTMKINTHGSDVIQGQRASAGTNR
jgi:hypothetical protein